MRSLLKSKYQFIIGLGNDEMGYIIPKAEWDERPPWLNNSPRAYYGEINSPGPETAQTVTHALANLITGASKLDGKPKKLRLPRAAPITGPSYQLHLVK